MVEVGPEIPGHVVRRQQINTAADAALTRLGDLASQSSVAMADTIDISRSFAEESGLLTHEGVREAIEQVDEQGGQASMIMLGNAVYSTLPFEGSSETALSARPVEAL